MAGFIFYLFAIRVSKFSAGVEAPFLVEGGKRCGLSLDVVPGHCDGILRAHITTVHDHAGGPPGQHHLISILDSAVIPV